MKTIQLKSIDNIADAAHEFIAQMGDETVYAFYGEMGAGKTTFINALCKAGHPLFLKLLYKHSILLLILHRESL